MGLVTTERVYPPFLPQKEVQAEFEFKFWSQHLQAV